MPVCRRVLSGQEKLQGGGDGVGGAVVAARVGQPEHAPLDIAVRRHYVAAPQYQRLGLLPSPQERLDRGLAVMPTAHPSRRQSGLAASIVELLHLFGADFAFGSHGNLPIQETDNDYYRRL